MTDITRKGLYNVMMKAPGVAERRITEEVLGGKIDKQKAYTMEQMAKRRCPMTLEGAARISGGLGADPDGIRSGRVPLRFRVVISELVEEGKLVETHRPDGEDTYHVPGGKWEPIQVTPQQADLINELVNAWKAIWPTSPKRPETEARTRHDHD